MLEKKLRNYKTQNKTKQNRKFRYLKREEKSVFVPRVILYNGCEAFNADVLQVVRVAADETADGCRRGVEQHSVRINSSYRFYHFIH